MKSKILYAEVICAIDATLILLCHYIGQSSNVWMLMTAQFFNISVPIFIILAGFLFGLQRDIQPCLCGIRKEFLLNY